MKVSAIVAFGVDRGGVGRNDSARRHGSCARVGWSSMVPFTTRWMLLDERVASLSCSLSQSGSLPLAKWSAPRLLSLKS